MSVILVSFLTVRYGLLRPWLFSNISILVHFIYDLLLDAGIDSEQLMVYR